MDLLSNLVNAAGSAYGNWNAAKAAEDNAKAMQAQAKSQAAQSNNLTKIAIYGGIALVVIVVLSLVFRRK